MISKKIYNWLWIIINLPYILGFFIYTMFSLRKTKGSEKRYDDENWYRFFLKFSKFYLYIRQVKVKYYNLENIKNNSSLIVSNHESNFDFALILLAYQKIKYKKDVHVIAKQELRKTFFFGKYINENFVLLLERKNLRHAIKLFKEAKNIINRKKSPVLIFPEGKRNPNGVGEFKSGALKIAYAAAAPIQPVTIQNSGNVYKYKSKKTIKVYFHKQIPYSNFAHLNTIKNSEIIHKLIKEKNIELMNKND